MVQRTYPSARRPAPLVVVAVLLLAAMAGCGEKKCIDTSKPALDRCNESVEQMQSQLNALKTQLAQALANPGTIKVDAGVVVVEGDAGSTRPRVREGTISQDEVIKTLRGNKSSLQPCYNRALKRDSSLHHRKITLNLSLKIKPSGTPSEISLGPNYEPNMLDCMKKAIQRWRFPTFTGMPVGVESPLTFKPKR